MRVFVTDNVPFSLDDTLSCGQVFRWKKDEEGWWRGIAHDHLIKIRQQDNRIEYLGCDEDFLVYYFNLDLDLDGVLAALDRDEYMHGAIEKHRGLRLLRQNPWECLLTYLCAQNANIPFIDRMLNNLSEKYGEPITSEFGCAKSYPRPEKLAAVSKEDIESCSLGYRSTYVNRTAEMIANDPMWADKLFNADYETARQSILHYDGIGPKVADCILLFGFQKYSSFPVDRWVDRIMYKYYNVGDPERALSNSEYNRIRKFGQDYFGEYAGYAQEYLFADRQML